MNDPGVLDRKSRILVVDDVMAARRVAVRLLQKVGFLNIEQARNGTEALEFLKNCDDVDFLLTDLHLQDMTAIELVSKVKARVSYKTLPVVVMTSDADKDQVLQAFEVGVTGYILKPFSAEILEDKINEAISKSDGNTK